MYLQLSHLLLSQGQSTKAGLMAALRLDDEGRGAGSKGAAKTEEEDLLDLLDGGN